MTTTRIKKKFKDFWHLTWMESSVEEEYTVEKCSAVDPLSICSSKKVRKEPSGSCFLFRTGPISQFRFEMIESVKITRSAELEFVMAAR